MEKTFFDSKNDNLVGFETIATYSLLLGSHTGQACKTVSARRIRLRLAVPTSGPQYVGLQVILQVIAVAGGCQKVDLRKTFHSNGAEDPAAAASAARAASAGIGGNCISSCHAPLVYRSRVVCVVTRPLVCCKCLPASEMHKVLVISFGCLAKSAMVTHRSLCV